MHSPDDIFGGSGFLYSFLFKNPSLSVQATSAKRRVEQAQRDAVKQREANGERWNTQVGLLLHLRSTRYDGSNKTIN